MAAHFLYLFGIPEKGEAALVPMVLIFLLKQISKRSHPLIRPLPSRNLDTFPDNLDQGRVKQGQQPCFEEELIAFPKGVSRKGRLRSRNLREGRSCTGRAVQ